LTKQGRQICLVSLLVAGTWAIPHVASACSCLPPEPPQGALEKAEAVFVGRVIAIEDQGGGETLPERAYQFEVSRFWKGEGAETITLTSALSSAACGRSYAMDEEYLVYATSDRKGGLADYLCSRTRTVISADEDLAVLGPGQQVQHTPEVTAPSDQEPPRIEPTPEPVASDPPATEPSSKGCAIAHAEDPSQRTPPLGLALLVLASGVVGRRRRLREEPPSGPVARPRPNV